MQVVLAHVFFVYYFVIASKTINKKNMYLKDYF